MIVECPRCGVRYPLDDTMVGSRGASVRCGNCHLVWREKALALSDNPLVPIQAELYKEKKGKWGWILAIFCTLGIGGALFKSSPIIQDMLETLFHLRHTKVVFQIRKFYFEHIKDSVDILCRGEIHNPSHQTLKSPTLLFYFVSPINREHYEKLLYPFEGVTLLPGQSYTFSVRLTPQKEGLSLVTVGLP